MLITQRMVLLRQNCCGPGVKKTRDILKVTEIVEENGPIRKLEIKCQLSHKIQFFLLKMDLERSETCRGYK